MDTNKTKFAAGRATMKSKFGLPGPEADRRAGVPAPPLSKTPLTANSIALPKYKGGMERADFYAVLQNRRSRRVFGAQPLTLEQLSVLLYATQGVQKIVGKGVQTTQRPVASGGARHAFETYITLQNAEGLQPGLYHYLALEHRLEFLWEMPDYQNEVAANLNGQTWAALAPAVFYWACDAYRCEWAYAENAHKLMLLDAGHVGQNLQLAAEALGLGSCCIASYNQTRCDAMLGLDGEDEFMVYAAAMSKEK